VPLESKKKKFWENRIIQEEKKKLGQKRVEAGKN